MADETTTDVASTTDDASTDTGTSSQKTSEESTTQTDGQQTDKADNQGKTFTQSDVTRIVTRETAKAVQAALAAKDAEAADAEKTELQKAQDKLKEKDDAIAAKDAKLRRSLILDEAREEAKRQGIDFDPGALSDAFKLGAFDDVEVSDDDTTSGVDAAIKALVKEKPYLVKSAKREPPDLDSQRGGRTAPGELTDAEKADIQRRFRIK